MIWVVGMLMHVKTHENLMVCFILCKLYLNAPCHIKKNISCDWKMMVAFNAFGNGNWGGVVKCLTLLYLSFVTRMWFFSIFKFQNESNSFTIFA
jgi:hypothetical protein